MGIGHAAATMSDELINCFVVMFQHGTYTAVRDSVRSREEIFSDFNRDRASDAPKIVETEVIVLPRVPSAQKEGRAARFTHTLAHLERTEPGTLFVGVLENDDYYRMRVEADQERQSREDVIHREIEATAHIWQQEIFFKDIPATLKERIRVRKSGCWIWKAATEVAPYRKVYRKLRGMIPHGSILRHTCDNRCCVNPNHLIPETQMDNWNDMWRRGRAPQQRRR